MRVLKYTMLWCLMITTTSQLSSQLDSLDVLLPWEIVNVSSCDASSGEGPISNDDNIVVSLDSEIFSYDDSGNCIAVAKKWWLTDWVNSEEYDFIQVVKVVDDPIVCTDDYVVLKKDLPLDLDVLSLVSDFSEDHIYSFSFHDIEDRNLPLSNTSEELQTVYVYDHTANTVCELSVIITECEEDIIVDIPTEGTIAFSEEDYIELTEENLGIVVDNPCETPSITISAGVLSLPVIFPQLIGETVPVEVEVVFESGTTYEKTIQVTVEGVGPAPIPMFIEEKTFSAGEEVTFDIWSDEIDGLVGWQFRLSFNNATIESIAEGPPFDNIPHNIFDDSKKINTIWTTATGFPIEYMPGETWFTLTVVPEIDGSTFDIFETSNDPWSSMVLEADDLILEYEVDFVFNIAPRNILNATTIETEKTRILRNTLVVDQLSLDQNYNENDIQIFSIDGAQVPVIWRDRQTLDVSSLSSGVYFIRSNKEGVSITEKFIKR